MQNMSFRSGTQVSALSHSQADPTPRVTHTSHLMQNGLTQLLTRVMTFHCRLTWCTLVPPNARDCSTPAFDPPDPVPPRLPPFLTAKPARLPDRGLSIFGACTPTAVNKNIDRTKPNLNDSMADHPWCFAMRILPVANASQTRFDKRKCSESLLDCFSHADEGFGLFLVANYHETQWHSQHDAAVRNPSGTRHQLELWKEGKHASATEGSGQGVSCGKGRA
jgi:hypothetical protein